MAELLFESEDDIRERELQDIDKNDILNPEIFTSYVNRLEQQDVLLRKHITGSEVPGSQAQALRQRLNAQSGLIGGQTNIGATPYRYMSPKSNLRDDPEYFRGNTGTEAVISVNNPYNVLFNPFVYEQSPTPRILAHEGAHQPYLRNLTRRLNVGLERKIDRPIVDWEPSFSVGFLRDIGKIKEPRHPLYGNKIGPHYTSEIMSFLIGREGELRQGKTLKDDPVTNQLFTAHPGMYEEYVKSRDLLLNIK